MIEMMREIRKLQDQIDALRTIEVGGRAISYTPTFTGFSANPTSTIFYYSSVGKLIHLSWFMGADGTSNATSFGFTLPKTANGQAYSVVVSGIIDNGSLLTTPGVATINFNGTTLDFAKDLAGGSFTASGGKRCVRGQISYLSA